MALNLYIAHRKGRNEFKIRAQSRKWARRFLTIELKERDSELKETDYIIVEMQSNVPGPKGVIEL